MVPPSLSMLGLQVVQRWHRTASPVPSQSPIWCRMLGTRGLAAQSRPKLSFPRLWCITLALDIDAPFWRLKIFESRAEHDSQRGPIRPILREHDEPKGVDMKQDEQKLVDMVLSEIQSILAELPPKDASVVVSGFNGLNAKPTVESKSAIPLTASSRQK
jgi:hypothetical protein